MYDGFYKSKKLDTKEKLIPFAFFSLLFFIYDDFISLLLLLFVIVHSMYFIFQGLLHFNLLPNTYFLYE